jgi:hypothetical protein
MKFKENPLSGSRLVPCEQIGGKTQTAETERQTDRQTDSQKM